ncbi:hypothetical protein GCM10010406_52870 [Streptomyces thermolineatus]|uniref:Uncharacterized protein n=1 Tax=Streptomyces thermolineatus TaxID=44033 RepID=A0ABP6A398_9ACTN
MDTLRFTLPLTREMVGFLEESDVEAILQVAVDRLRTLHPEYEVQTYSTWSGVCATDPVTEYTPPALEPIPTELGQTTG